MKSCEGCSSEHRKTCAKDPLSESLWVLVLGSGRTHDTGEGKKKHSNKY